MQKEFVGAGSIASLGAVVAAVAPSRIFLVTGKHSYEESGASGRVPAALRGRPVVRFSDFSVNPALPDIEKGIALLRQSLPDMVIAVGGGSVIDMAKCINTLAENEGEPQEYITGKKKVGKKGKPLVAVPTTAGSGSEATHFAVAYIEERKYSLAAPTMLPDYAIVDAAFTYHLPAGITAATGMDALCQSIESYWSVQSTVESQKYAREAVPLIVRHIRDAVHRGNPESRDAMMLAAHLAGKAINISKTTASHAMSYPLTAHFGIAHGHAVALTIGQMFAFNSAVTAADVKDPRGVEYVRKTLTEIIETFKAKDAADATGNIRTLMEDIGLQTKLSQLHVTPQDFPLILSHISEERAGNNPRRFDTASARGVLESIL